MGIVYKIDVLKELKEKGFSTYKLRKGKLLGEATIQKLREGHPVSWENISIICNLLSCDVGDILTNKKTGQS